MKEITMNEFITILKVLWLCLTVYVLVKDSIVAYITVIGFLNTGNSEIGDKVKKIPSNIGLRVVNVVLSSAILYYM